MRSSIYKIILAATVLSLSSTVTAAPASYNFAGIKWSQSKATVKAQMAAKGYTYERVDDDGDLWFKGTVSQEKASIVASFTPANQLVQMQVIMKPEENFLAQRYKILKEALRDKYGKPEKDQFAFAAPYKADDGFTGQALKQGKATLKAVWYTAWKSDGKGSKTSYAGLSIQADKDIRIYITYIAEGWNAEYDRRYKKGNNDL